MKPSAPVTAARGLPVVLLLMASLRCVGTRIRRAARARAARSGRDVPGGAAVAGGCRRGVICAR
ncbi:hypothetical protein KNE206_39810 [Kitasatospora sp. NE20-6]